MKQNKNDLLSMLILSKALGMILKPKEGIVVELDGEMMNLSKHKKVIIYMNETREMLHVIEYGDTLPDGSRVTMNYIEDN